MARRSRPEYVEAAPPIRKLEDVPGPEAEAGILRAHYRRVQEILATSRYDDVLLACGWCCDTESGLAFTKPDQPRGTRMFHSERCAAAYGAYQSKCLHGGRESPKVEQATPSNSDETPDEPHEAPPQTCTEAERDEP